MSILHVNKMKADSITSAVHSYLDVKKKKGERRLLK